jgi:nitroreductase
MIVEEVPKSSEVKVLSALEAIGLRRSIRWYNPAKPVEKWKIQAMLEAARLASTVGNVCATRAIVCYRDENPEIWEYISDWSQITTQMAPVLIFWGYDMAAWDTEGQRIHDLMRVGAADRAHGWDYDRVARMFPLPKILPDIILDRITAIDLGNALQNAMVAATALGLATCLNGFGGAVRTVAELSKLLGAPRTFVLCWMMTVGYPLESMEAGGQRPRMPFEEMFFERRWGKPFKKDERATELLKELGLLQPEAPLPGRLRELNVLTKAVGLGDEWLTDWALEPSGCVKPGVIRDTRPRKLTKEELEKTLFGVTPTVLREKAREYLEKKGRR